MRNEFIAFGLLFFAACSSGERVGPALTASADLSTATLPPTTTLPPTLTSTPWPTRTPTATSTPLPIGAPLPTPTPQSQVISQANARRVTELRTFGQGFMSRFEWSPDGDIIAVSSQTGVYLYDPLTLEEISRLGTTYIGDITFSPDGKILAAGYDLWDVETGELIRSLEERGPHAQVTRIIFSPGGSLVAMRLSVGGGGDPPIKVKVWKTHTGELLYESEEVYAPAGPWFISGGRRLMMPLWGNVQMLDTTAWEVVSEIDPELDYGLRISPNGQYAASIGRSVWDVETGENVLTFGGRTSFAAFSGHGNLVAATNGTIWSIGTASALQTLDTDHENAAFSLNGNSVLYWGSHSGQPAAVYNVDNGQHLFSLEGSEFFGGWLSYSPDGLYIYGKDGSDDPFTMWGARTGKKLRELFPSTDIYSVIALHPNGNLAIKSMDFHSMLFMDLNTGEVNSTLESIDHPITFMGFSSDGQYLITRTDGEKVELWHMRSGEKIGEFSRACAIASNIYHQVLGIAGSYALTDFINERPIVPLQTPNKRCFRAIAFDFDANLFFAADTSDVIIVGDLSDGSTLSSLSFDSEFEYEDPIRAFSVSPDGKWLASAASKENLSIFIWDIEQFDIHTLLEGHESRRITWIGDGYGASVTGLAFSPDGSLLASIGDDGTLRLWDPARGLLLHTVQLWGTLNKVMFSAAGDLIILHDSADVIRIFGLPQK